MVPSRNDIQETQTKLEDTDYLVLHGPGHTDVEAPGCLVAVGYALSSVVAELHGVDAADLQSVSSLCGVERRRLDRQTAMGSQRLAAVLTAASAQVSSDPDVDSATASEPTYNSPVFS